MASVPNFFSPSLASWTGYKPYRELLFLGVRHSVRKDRQVHNKKTNTYNSARRGVWEPSCSPWQEDRMAPFSLHFVGRSHMRSLRNSYTGEFDQHTINCFVSMGMGHRGRQLRAKQRASSHLACFLGRSRGCCLPHLPGHGAGSFFAPSRLQHQISESETVFLFLS